MKDTINLYFPKGRDNGMVSFSVPAIVMGSLALHRQHNIEGAETTPKAWRITHIASGANITSAMPYTARDGRRKRSAYVAWIKRIQDLDIYKAWADIMDTAPFGTSKPADLGGKCVDLSRLMVQETRNIVDPFVY